MAISKITIEEFLTLAKTNLVLDVRSPSEYAHAHIPSAKSLPLFNDEERKIVGTAYKQQSKQVAIKLGLDFFGSKMNHLLEQAEEQLAASKEQFTKSSLQTKVDCPLPIANCILLHCWRGGMRSAGVAWLLDLYGFKVYTLVGGYKAYRNWVLQQFEKEYHFKIIGGYTGSGKTLLLDALAKENNATIDLEGLANHKGSALGALGQLPQPTQEMFENLLAKELLEKNKETLNNNELIANCSPPTANCLWLEDESQRIGNLQIPMPLWRTMRSSKVYFFDIPFEERLNYLTEEYGVQKKDGLVTAIMRIQKRLGGLETKTAINFLLENNFKESFRILLTYYDKYYLKGLYNRENGEGLIHAIIAGSVNANKNIELLNKLFK
jgi:tRNA 2-selenouridine synthase